MSPLLYQLSYRAESGRDASTEGSRHLGYPARRRVLTPASLALPRGLR